jgi:CubicO group peptidase (beta-lactamase class C family)
MNITVDTTCYNNSKSITIKPDAIFVLQEGIMSPKKSNESWPLPLSEPEQVGFSSDRLARICPGLQKFIDTKKVPHLVTLVARHGKIVHYEAQGYMDFKSKKPVQKDIFSRLWSNTKPISGTATMICVEDGLLGLDDPVSKFIPAFENQVIKTQEAGRGLPMGFPTVPVSRGITVRDCLRNTTGLPTARRAPIWYLTEFRDTLTKSGLLTQPAIPSGGIREMVEALAKLPLECEPGTQFEYQVGYPILGIVLEVATGKTLEEFYQERIFKPLGMKDSSFYPPKNILLGRFPTLYRPVKESGGWKLIVAETPETSEKVKGDKNYFEAGGGGGGVLSTAADYVRLAQMLLNGGELDGVRILGRKTVELMTSDHLGDIPIALTGPGFGFGMGVGVYKGSVPPLMRSVGTFGWSGAAGTTCFIDPKEDLIAICFSQVFMHHALPDNTYQEEFERLVYQALI